MSTKYFQIQKFFLISSVLFVLSACGGGGSSSGGGGPSADFSGTYRGTQAVRYSGPRIQPASTTFRVAIVVNKAGRVVYTDGVGAWEGQINGNSFEIRADIEPAVRIAGILCRGPQRFNGTVNGNVISGQYEAKLVCLVPNTRNEQTNLLFKGDFRVARTSVQTRAIAPSELNDKG